jgi:hypothetical protein
VYRGSDGIRLLLVAVQVLPASGAAALVDGWTLVVRGVGAALVAFRELWETRADQRR